MFIDPVTPDAAGLEYVEAQRAQWGFVPNFAACFVGRPDIAAAWAGLGNAIGSSMDRRRYEIATLAAARARKSTYCAAAHSKFLRDVCGDEPTMRAIVDDPTGGGLTGADRAVFEFATKLARDAASVTQADVDALRDAGLDDRDVANVVYTVAARLFFTTVLDGLGAQLDHQTAESFDPELRAGFVVGRPAASG